MKKKLTPRFGEFTESCNHYRIPVMDIQNVLFNLDSDKRVIRLLFWLAKNSNPEQWRIEFNLERQWYPELVTDDRWLAASFIRAMPTFSMSITK